MLPIFVRSSAKHIATQILVIVKLNGRKDFFWETLFVMSSVPIGNYLFKVSNWNTRTRCENCSRLRMNTLEQCQWRRSSVFIVNCTHISNFLLIIEFEQVKVCWVHIEKINTFENKIRFSSNLSLTKIYKQMTFEVIPSQPYGWISEKFCERVYFRLSFWLIKMWLTF